MVEGSVYTCPAVCTALYIFLAPAWPQLRLWFIIRTYSWRTLWFMKANQCALPKKQNEHTLNGYYSDQNIFEWNSQFTTIQQWENNELLVFLMLDYNNIDCQKRKQENRQEYWQSHKSSISVSFLPHKLQRFKDFWIQKYSESCNLGLQKLP